MKKIIILMAAMIAAGLSAAGLHAQSKADAILGSYECFEQGNESRIKFTKAADGTFSGTLFWVKDDIDPKTGEPLKDYRNPDKSLRNRYTHDITIVEGLKYNADKQMWEKGKIYDPGRGIKVTCTAKFEGEGTLVIRGSVLGIGESITWKKMK